MAKIYMNAPSHEVKNVDVIFDVFVGNSVLGTLSISKGTIEWRPKNAKRSLNLDWRVFDKLMKENGWPKG